MKIEVASFACRPRVLVATIALCGAAALSVWLARSSTATNGAGAESPRPDSAAPAAPVESACELARRGEPDGTQYVAIVVRSIDDLYRLELPSLPSISLLDHPSAEPEPDGRISVGAYVTDVTLGALCARGCTSDRGCGVRVIVTKQQHEEHLDRIR